MANTLAIAHDLEAAGFDRRQAEALAQAVDAASASSLSGIRKEMVTKADFKVELADVKGGITSLETRTAAIEADVADIKTRITGLETRITGLETRVAVIEADVADIKTRVTRLEADVADIKTEITDIKTEITDIKVGISNLAFRMMLFGAASVLGLVAVQVALAVGLYLSG